MNHINATKHKHIVTLENPLEFLHRDIQCSVTQREIGVDTESFRMGLRAALRQDPDVILIGEMRDAETIDTAMKAAETGHLLISTLHTPDAQSTVMRILAMFPAEEQDVVRVRLAETLHAVVSQRLLPKKDGHGRVAACEVMIVTPTIRELMLDKDRIGEIRDFIADGREQYGMQTFDQHLADLVHGGRSGFRGGARRGHEAQRLRAQHEDVPAPVRVGAEGRGPGGTGGRSDDHAVGAGHRLRHHGRQWMMRDHTRRGIDR